MPEVLYTPQFELLLGSEGGDPQMESGVDIWTDYLVPQSEHIFNLNAGRPPVEALPTEKLPVEQAAMSVSSPETITAVSTPTLADLKLMFIDNKIQTWDKAEPLLQQLFDEMYGDCGKEEYNSILLPRVKRLFGNNIRKGGDLLLTAIESGAMLPSTTTEEYFRSVVSEADVQANMALNKAEQTEKVIASAQDGIQHVNQRFPGKMPAVVLYGSTARGELRIGEHASDIDWIPVVQGEEYIVDQEGQRLYYEDVFQVQFKPAASTLGHELDPPFAQFNLQDETTIQEFVEAFIQKNDPFIVIAQNDVVRAQVEELIRMYQVEQSEE